MLAGLNETITINNIYGNTVKESKKKICIIASVDLAHVGSRFGDTELQDDAYLDTLRSVDTDMLKRTFWSKSSAPGGGA